MNLTELAEYLEVSRPTAYQILKMDGFPEPLPGTNDGLGARRWDKSAVDLWLASQVLPLRPWVDCK